MIFKIFEREDIEHGPRLERFHVTLETRHETADDVSKAVRVFERYHAKFRKLDEKIVADYFKATSDKFPDLSLQALLINPQVGFKTNPDTILSIVNRCADIPVAAKIAYFNCRSLRKNEEVKAKLKELGQITHVKKDPSATSEKKKA